jgi:N-acetylglucosamine-6-phosphate deacetylase
VPRRKTTVKGSALDLVSIGAIDLHFHGAFGIDLMTATPTELQSLERKLWKHGIAGYCPTTLSTTPRELAQAVTRLGRWIRDRQHAKPTRGAPIQTLPLGIHLEGPFINSVCCGAHPPSMIRPVSLRELDDLWEKSLHTLRILTIAPETLSPQELKKLCSWARTRGISLSLGHSKATEKEAKQAFQAGFRGVTHAWNALGFHQRSPGPLGAALGNPNTYVELIIDQVHVSPTVMEWTAKLHPAERLCFISDCVPAAETSSKKTTSFGPLSIRYQDGACRLHAPGKSTHGALAGGGKTLTRSLSEWIQSRAGSSQEARRLLKNAIPSITTAPLWAISVPRSLLARHQVRWSVSASGRVLVTPL